MKGTKPFSISKQRVYAAYLKIASNRGSGGVDGVSLKEFRANYKNNLYKLWNQMSSGSYMPSAVKLMEIPKKDGGVRPLGIPTVGMARKRCWDYDWVMDLDIKGFFDNILHDELMKAVRKHC